MKNHKLYISIGVLLLAGTLAMMVAAAGPEQVSGVIEQVQILSCKNPKEPNAPPTVSTAGTRTEAVIAGVAWVHVNDYQGRERRIYKSNGEAHMVEDDLRVRTSVKDSEHFWKGLPDPGANCSVDRYGRPYANTFLDGQETISGLLTYRYKHESGGRTVYFWYAPSMECATVKGLWVWGDGNTTELRPTSIKIGDPPPALFAVDKTFENMNLIERKNKRFLKTVHKLREEDLSPKQRENIAKRRQDTRVVDYFNTHRLD